MAGLVKIFGEASRGLLSSHCSDAAREESMKRQFRSTYRPFTRQQDYQATINAIDLPLDHETDQVRRNNNPRLFDCFLMSLVGMSKAATRDKSCGSLLPSQSTAMSPSSRKST